MSKIQSDFLKNPWMGLASYQEADSHHPFCGRSQATKEVSSLVDNNLFLLLYGRTGIGKTSLLKAGVFPVLRRANYLPLYIRLGNFGVDKSYSHAIVDCIRTEIANNSCQIISTHQVDPDADDYIWKFFSSSTFYNANKEVIYPVIVLDQLEEIFLKRKEDAWELMRQIYRLLDDTHIIDRSLYHTETNFRFVVSIREDYLYRLEECIDTLCLTEMLYCRYRLAPMTASEASSVVMIPGKDIIEQSDSDVIVQKVIEVSRNESDGEISCLLLSLACSQLYQIYKSQINTLITKDHLRFLDSNPLEGIYKTARQKLKRKQLTFIEKHLIDNEGKRTSVSLEKCNQIIPTEEFLEGNTKIFNLVTIKNANAEHSRIELLHDMLAKAVYEEKMKRNDLAVFLRRVAFDSAFYSFAMFLDILVLMFFILNRSAGLVNFYLITSAVLIIGNTCWAIMGHLHKDIKLALCVLPHIVCTLYLYLLTNAPNIHAYHSLRPSVYSYITTLFLIVNILLFLLNLAQITINRKEFHNRYSWREFLGFDKTTFKKISFSYLTIVIGVIASMLVFSFVPKTSIELLRERAERNDPEALYQMGDYYMRYCPDFDMASTYFKKAKELGHEDAQQRCKTIYSEYRNRYKMSEKLQTSILRILLSDAESRGETLPIETIEKIYKGDIRNLAGLDINLIYKVLYVNDGNDDFDNETRMEFLSKVAIIDATCRGNLGYQMWRGEFVEQDLVRAFELYMDSKSHDNVIVCYLNGWGVERSVAKARDYYNANKDQISGTWFFDYYVPDSSILRVFD